MLAQSLILAHLAKSLKGQGTQQDGDTKLLVPNVLQPVAAVPLPFFVVYSLAQSSDTQITSFQLSDSRVFAANGNTVLCIIGPGLWRINWHHHKRLTGIGNDNTSLCQLLLTLVDGVNPSSILSEITNDSAPGAFHQGSFDITISSEQKIQFNALTTIGAGTGTANSRIVIQAFKLL